MARPREDDERRPKSGGEDALTHVHRVHDRQRRVRDIVDAALYFANGAGGTVVVGVANKVTGKAALTGASLAVDVVRKRIYDLTEPPLLVDGKSSIIFVGQDSGNLSHVPGRPVNVLGRPSAGGLGRIGRQAGRAIRAGGEERERNAEKA